MLITILIAILAINILVLVHELGHFIVAKLRGITVEIFSIGFGPRVLGFNWRGTEYRLSLLLFGGYVKFKGDELEDQNRGIQGGFYTANPYSRILVCIAGGFFNVILAWVLYLVIFIQGKPVSEDFLNTIVGEVKEESIAQKIGILPGDKIIRINSKPVYTWEELVYSIAFSKTEEVTIELNRNGQMISKTTAMTPDPETGIRMLGVYSKETIMVEQVVAESGLKVGDNIIAVNGEKIFRLEPLIETIRDSEDKEITLTVIRDGQGLDIKAVPKKRQGEEYATIGFAPGTKWTIIYTKPWEQFWDDLVRTWRTLSGLITRNIPVKAISGPVGIIGIIGISLQVGWIPLLSIIALISLNLGIVNLLPIPVLDGGHIMFNLLEAIRKRPLSIKTIIRIQNVFTGLLVLLALYVTYNDILRWIK